uniref:Crystaline entomocidal protoxin n=1 Tax=Bacillus thuringiensis TaxID=1428 RepID=S5VRK7_BACTU|nr:Cry21a [Bacillus thuringiensis]
MILLVQLSDLLPSYYNVLASPPTILDANQDWFPTGNDFKSVINELKDAFTKFQKDFHTSDLINTIQSIYNSYGSQGMDWVNVAQAVITFAFGFVPGGSLVSAGLNKIIGIFFPKDPNPTVFDQIKAAVEQLILNSFITYDIQGDITELNKLKDYSGILANSIQVALGQSQFQEFQQVNPTGPPTNCTHTPSCTLDPTNPIPPNCSCLLNFVYQNYNNHTSDINTVLLQIEGSIPKIFALINQSTTATTAQKNQLKSDYLQAYLPLYVMGATLEMIYYRTYIQFAETFQYGLSEQNSTTLTAMHNLRLTISRRTTFLFNNFLPFLPSITSNTKGDLNSYIQYTRRITINALDTAVFWTLLDPFDYPVSANQTLSRIIFNDIVGPVECKAGNQNSNNLLFNFYNVDGQPLPNNSITNYFYNNMQLRGLQFQIYKYSSTSTYFSTTSDIPIGFKASYRTNGSDKNIDHTRSLPYGLKGSTTTLTDDIYITNPSFNIINMNSSQTSGQIATDVSQILYTPISDIKQNCFSQNSPYLGNNRIQAIYPLQPTNPNTYNAYGSTDKLGFLTTLISNDTTTNLVFTSDPIYTFPAEQATVLSGTKLVEYVNGTASVQLQNGQNAQYTIDNTTRIAGPTQFQLRVHVATDPAVTDPNVLGQLAITIDNQRTQYLTIPNTNVDYSNPITLLNGQQLNQLRVKGTQGAYMLVPASNLNNINDRNTNVFTLNPNASMNVNIQNTGNLTVILDRIEFVPIDSTVIIPAQTLYSNQAYTLWESTNGLIGKQALLVVDDYLHFTVQYYYQSQLVHSNEQNIYDVNYIGLFDKITASTIADTLVNLTNGIVYLTTNTTPTPTPAVPSPIPPISNQNIGAGFEYTVWDGNNKTGNTVNFQGFAAPNSGSEGLLFQYKYNDQVIDTDQVSNQFSIQRKLAGTINKITATGGTPNGVYLTINNGGSVSTT